jgi:cytochrome d ubiquinol oxidase subunit II
MTLFDLISYDVLRVIWWGLLGVLLIGFALTDGFDMGVGALLPFVGKTDTERRMVINTVGPVWEGNQVWFILGGGAIFAAWPPLYAVSFSGFYLAMFVVLAAFIVRPVAFKYRSKRVAPAWRSAWDWALFAGGAVPALIFGVAVGNVLQGVPFHLTDTLYPMYDGTFYAKFLGLLNPFAQSSPPSGSGHGSGQSSWPPRRPRRSGAESAPVQTPAPPPVRYWWRAMQRLHRCPLTALQRPHFAVAAVE